MNKITIVLTLIILTVLTTVVYRSCNQEWLAFSKAEHFYKNKNYDEAINYYLIAIQKGVVIDNLVGHLAKSLLATDKYKTQFSLFEDLKNKNPENVSAFSKLGNFFFIIEDYRESIKFYEYVLNLKPNDKITRYGLALSLSRSGEYDRAADEYKILLSEK